MGRDDLANFVHVRFAALAESHADLAAHFTAGDQIDGAVTVEIGEVDDRAVAQRVHVDRCVFRS